MSTFDEYLGGLDPQAPPSMAGPGSVRGMPAHSDPNMTGLRSLHPGASPTPWVIGLALVLALLLHPKAGFQAGAHAKVG